MTVPTAAQLSSSLTEMIGPLGSSPVRGQALHGMVQRLHSLVGEYGLQRGPRYMRVAHPEREGETVRVMDRRSTFAGRQTPTLFHKLELAFHKRSRVLVSPARRAQRIAAYRQHLFATEPIYADLELLTVTALREHFAGLVATRGRITSTFTGSGLDSLGRNMGRMDFLPPGIRNQWTDLGEDVGCEGDDDSNCHPIHAASIPRSHEMYAFAGMLRLRHDELVRAARRAGAPADFVTSMNDAQRRAWTQVAFGRPYGPGYNASRRNPDAQFAGDHAGLNMLLEALVHYDREGSLPLDASAIFTHPPFASNTVVRIARARAVEAAVLDTYGFLSPSRRVLATDVGPLQPAPPAP